MSGHAERLREARLMAFAGRRQEALAEVEAILDEAPEHLGALLMKAELLQQLGAGEAAAVLLERAVDVAPDSAEAWNERARCLHALGRHDEALPAAERARALLADPANAAHVPAVYLTLLWCLREKRLFREALAAAEECLARTPDAVVAEWAGQIEQELAEAERDRC
jgi:tetratricopeptide (TPR) repeat protein